MKEHLGKVISKNQYAFVLGRAIQDSLIIANEGLNYLKKRKRYGGRMVMKLDMLKAYDRVEWNFLLKVLRKLGFSEKWCN